MSIVLHIPKGKCSCKSICDVDCSSCTRDNFVMMRTKRKAIAREQRIAGCKEKLWNTLK
jgi:hypothetical protein